MIFAPLDGAAAQPPAYYVHVSYDTLKRRAKQLDTIKGELPWEFVAALVAKESGFSYTSTSKAGAYGLFQLMPSTARTMGANWEDYKRSVNIQLAAGRKFLALNYAIVKQYAPELVVSGGADLWSILYHGHNLGVYGNRDLLKKLAAQGLPATWQNFRSIAPLASRCDVAEEVASLTDEFSSRYAELVQDAGPAVASTQYTYADAPADLASDLQGNPNEGDGDAVAVPPELAEDAPTETPPLGRFLWGALGLAFLGAGGIGLWALAQRVRRKRG